MQAKIQTTKESIIKTYKQQRENLVRDIENQTEFDIGDSAFQEVERSLKLLGKQFMLENTDNPEGAMNSEAANIACGNYLRSTLANIMHSQGSAFGQTSKFGAPLKTQSSNLRKSYASGSFVMNQSHTSASIRAIMGANGKLEKEQIVDDSPT